MQYQCNEAILKHAYPLSPINQASPLNGALIGSLSTHLHSHACIAYSCKALAVSDSTKMNSGYQVDVSKPPLNPSNSDKLKRQNDH